MTNNTDLNALKSILNLDNLITRRAAAALLGRCTATVYREERAGNLKPYRPNSRNTLYRLGDVIALKDRWAQNPQAPSVAPQTNNATT